jgi:hypothetical protein
MKNQRNQAYTLGVPNRARIMGSWQFLVDQQALPPNPVESTALKTLSMAIRNEVTSRKLSVRSMTE